MASLRICGIVISLLLWQTGYDAYFLCKCKFSREANVLCCYIFRLCCYSAGIHHSWRFLPPPWINDTDRCVNGRDHRYKDFRDEDDLQEDYLRRNFEDYPHKDNRIKREEDMINYVEVDNDDVDPSDGNSNYLRDSLNTSSDQSAAESFDQAITNTETSPTQWPPKMALANSGEPSPSAKTLTNKEKILSELNEKQFESLLSQQNSRKQAATMQQPQQRFQNNKKLSAKTEKPPASRLRRPEPSLEPELETRRSLVATLMSDFQKPLTSENKFEEPEVQDEGLTASEFEEEESEVEDDDEKEMEYSEMTPKRSQDGPPSETEENAQSTETFTTNADVNPTTLQSYRTKVPPLTTDTETDVKPTTLRSYRTKAPPRTTETDEDVKPTILRSYRTKAPPRTTETDADVKPAILQSYRTKVPSPTTDAETDVKPATLKLHRIKVPLRTTDTETDTDVTTATFKAYRATPRTTNIDTGVKPTPLQSYRTKVSSRITETDATLAPFSTTESLLLQAIRTMPPMPPGGVLRIKYVDENSSYVHSKSCKPRRFKKFRKTTPNSKKVTTKMEITATNSSHRKKTPRIKKVLFVDTNAIKLKKLIGMKPPSDILNLLAKLETEKETVVQQKTKKTARQHRYKIVIKLPE